MITEILVHTPLYVWAMLAFFVYRGLAARRDRDVSVPSLFILPAVLVVMGLQGIGAHYGFTLAPVATWIAVAALGAALGAKTLGTNAVGVGAKGILMRGSWFPLVLVLAVFLTKYSTEVLIAMRPDVMLAPEATLGVCALYGGLTGFFLGRLGRALSIYRSLSRAEESAVLAT